MRTRKTAGTIGVSPVVAHGWWVSAWGSHARARPCRYALQRCVVCLTAGNNFRKENALQHRPPESLPSPLLCHPAQSEATCELIKPGRTVTTSPPPSLPSVRWHSRHPCAIWGSPAWHRAPRCDTQGSPGTTQSTPCVARGGGRAVDAQPWRSLCTLTPIRALSSWGH